MELNSPDRFHTFVHYIGDRIAVALTGKRLAPAIDAAWSATDGHFIVEINSGRWRSTWTGIDPSTFYPCNLAVGIDSSFWVDLYWHRHGRGSGIPLWPAILIWNQHSQTFDLAYLVADLRVSPSMAHLLTTVDQVLDGGLLLPMSYVEGWRELAVQAFPATAFEHLRTLGWTGNYNRDVANGVDLLS